MNGALIKIICASGAGIAVPAEIQTVYSCLFLKKFYSVIYFCWEIDLINVAKVFGKRAHF